MADVDPLTITMSVGLWSGIDATMDIKQNQARWEYWESGGDFGDAADPDVGPTARFANSIREEGWRQISDGQPEDAEINVSLTRRQWTFIAEAARHDLPMYDDLAQEADGQSKREMLDSAELCRVVIAVVSQALTAGPHIAP